MQPEASPNPALPPFTEAVAKFGTRASCRVAERLGMRLEGTARELFFEGRVVQFEGVWDFGGRVAGPLMGIGTKAATERIDELVGCPSALHRKLRMSGLPEVSQSADDRVRELANTLVANGRFTELERELAALNSKSLRSNEIVTWHVLWIASAFRRGDRKTAFERAMAGAKELPDEPEIIFALGQEYEYRGEIDRMLDCFRQSSFLKTSAAHTLAAARYCYLRGHSHTGIELLQPLVEAHFSLKIIDDTFLFIRRMPPATTTFSTAICLSLLDGGLDVARKTLRNAAETLGDDSVSDLVPYLDAIEQSAPSIVVQTLEAQRPPHLSSGPFGGFSGIHLAVWRARTAHTFTEATSLLERISLRETDHQWLHDARTLALAESCHQFGDSAQEAAIVGEFVKRQPLLLEPEWALKFGFIKYQERVRTSYWLTDTGRSKA